MKVLNFLIYFVYTVIFYTFESIKAMAQAFL